MKYALSLLLLASLSGHALMLKPGLWKTEMKITQDGKEFDPMSKLKEAMKDMPAERRKQMMRAMEQSGVSVKKPGETRLCYTKEMIENARFGVHEDKNCRTETSKKSKDKIVSKFSCEDGSKGTMVMKIKNKKAYTGQMEMTDAQGKKSELKYEARFVSADCGSVKPVRSE